MTCDMTFLDIFLISKFLNNTHEYWVLILNQSDSIATSVKFWPFFIRIEFINFYPILFAFFKNLNMSHKIFYSITMMWEGTSIQRKTVSGVHMYMNVKLYM